jgi:hypothetical protein
MTACDPIIEHDPGVFAQHKFGEFVGRQAAGFRVAVVPQMDVIVL